MEDKPEKTEIKKNDKVTEKNSDNKRGWNAGSIFWGLLLVLVGGLFLVNNLDIADVNFASLWQLWPLLIVAVGLSIIPIKGKLGTVLTAIFTVAALTLVTLTALGYVNPQADNKTVTRNAVIKTAEVEKLRLNIGGGAGTININSADTDEVKAKLQSSFAKLHNESSVKGDTQNIEISMDGQGHWLPGSYKNDLTVTIPESLPVELIMDAGAISIEGDLSKLELTRLDIDSGASSIDLKLGSLATVNRVSIDVGMSSVQLSLPKNIGTQVEIDSGLSSRTLPGLKEVAKNRFESDNFDKATNKAIITGSIGMASFDLVYY